MYFLIAFLQYRYSHGDLESLFTIFSSTLSDIFLVRSCTVYPDYRGQYAMPAASKPFTLNGCMTSTALLFVLDQIICPSPIHKHGKTFMVTEQVVKCPSQNCSHVPSAVHPQVFSMPIMMSTSNSDALWLSVSLITPCASKRRPSPNT